MGLPWLLPAQLPGDSAWSKVLPRIMWAVSHGQALTSAAFSSLRNPLQGEKSPPMSLSIQWSKTQVSWEGKCPGPQADSRSHTPHLWDTFCSFRKIKGKRRRKGYSWSIAKIIKRREEETSCKCKKQHKNPVRACWSWGLNPNLPSSRQSLWHEAAPCSGCSCAEAAKCEGGQAGAVSSAGPGRITSPPAAPQSSPWNPCPGLEEEEEWLERMSTEWGQASHCSSSGFIFVHSLQVRIHYLHLHSSMLWHP